MTSLAIARTDSTDLFVRWQQHGDRSARDELVTRFLPLARKLARRYAGAREPFEDLLQVASLGLVKAVDRFDAERGTAFSSFAVPTILGELKRYFRDLGWSVHVPRGAQEQALKVEEAQQTLTTKTGRPPSVPELAEYLEMSIEDVLDALETAGAHHSTSLDAPREDADGESGSLVDAFGQEDERFELVDARYEGHTQHGEGWFRPDAEQRRIEWGSRSSSYHGWMQVDPDGDGSRLTLFLATAHGDAPDAEVMGTLDSIRRLVERSV